MRASSAEQISELDHAHWAAFENIKKHYDTVTKVLVDRGFDVPNLHYYETVQWTKHIHEQHNLGMSGCCGLSRVAPHVLG